MNFSTQSFMKFGLNLSVDIRMDFIFRTSTTIGYKNFPEEEKQRRSQSKERTLSGTHSNYRRLIQKPSICVCFVPENGIRDPSGQQIIYMKRKGKTSCHNVICREKRVGDFSVMKSCRE